MCEAWINLTRACLSPADRAEVPTSSGVGAKRAAIRFSSSVSGYVCAEDVMIVAITNNGSSFLMSASVRGYRRGEEVSFKFRKQRPPPNKRRTKMLTAECGMLDFT